VIVLIAIGKRGFRHGLLESNLKSDSISNEVPSRV
jgi:hypothetical protein